MFGEDVQYREEEANEGQGYKRAIWSVGFGLQAVDGLVPSGYMVELAEAHVLGQKSYEEIESELNVFYGESGSEETMEADYASLRIVEILSTDGFVFSPATLLGYHRLLFSDVESFGYPVGKFRDVNITKDEAVLNGETVIYGDFRMLKDTLMWDFEQEKDKDYTHMGKSDVVFEVMDFISDVWQIHPFRDGNTRTIAVFAIKYLRYLGFEVDNEPFKMHSKFFRDALVFANCHKEMRTDKYFRMFVENALLGAEHELVIGD